MLKTNEIGTARMAKQALIAVSSNIVLQIANSRICFK